MGRVAYRGGTPDDCPPSVARRESTAKVGELFAIRNERLCMTAFGMVIYGANGRDGEGFRVPAGVRKPLMQEPAGHSRWLWGFRSVADVGAGKIRAGKCGNRGRLVALLRGCSVLSTRYPAPFDRGCGDRWHRRVRIRCRRSRACGYGVNRSMPGHGLISRFVAFACGGPRGFLLGSNVSIMIMRPPQQGHGVR